MISKSDSCCSHYGATILAWRLHVCWMEWCCSHAEFRQAFAVAILETKISGIGRHNINMPVNSGLETNWRIMTAYKSFEFEIDEGPGWIDDTPDT